MLNLNLKECLTIAQIQDHPFFYISKLEASSSDRISKIFKYQLTLKESDSKLKILANGYHPSIINRISDIYPYCISKIIILEHMFRNLKRFIIGDDLFNNCMFNNMPSYVLNATLIFVGRAVYLKNQKVLLYKLNDKTQGALFIDNTNISYNPKNIKYQYIKADSGSNFSYTNN
ncbi:hypothetical protein CONCODRAFT_13336 [Conidiobolus coronatus NRRL 28638]|uniref:Uncharacterized protein n=1 Tax=Conidiobolus coronatus (strain ATCC 28846 / CBS 209.66 / NRRL 28638) TaxID=796925 RepID=A0A137NR19_CONC2|nr:hypothetical protein CONCODRAFT_13336 [Conidiobolus coronatus NRRL 28638]|eukprot:KXN65175.1 hypothetical protein CONCODRAFT_13336 [Conidiobolus coronatus NRRL 28638]